MNLWKNARTHQSIRSHVGQMAVHLGGPTAVLLIALLFITGALPGKFVPLQGAIGHDPANLHARRLLVLRAETTAPGAPPLNNIWMVRADGTDLHRITNEAHGVLDFAVSPDGIRIVFVTADEGSSTALWIVDTDGANRTRLSSPMDHARYLSPAWSPAGDAILYVRYELATPRPGGGMPPSASAITLVSETGKIWAISPEGKIIGRVYGNGDEAGEAPVWSPDASRAALLEVFPQIGKSNLVITDFGDIPLKIPVEIALHVSWSPDGQWLAFDELTPGGKNTSHIVLLRADGTARKPLFNDATQWDSAPAWSPDGGGLAFIRRNATVPMGAVGRPDEVWRTTVDGRGLHRLFGGENLASSDINWSPDGQILAATRYSVIGATQRGVWIVDMNGAGAHLLLDNAIRPLWLQ